MDIRTCHVEASAVIPGVGGKNIGPGQDVDLDEVIGGGYRIRDLFPEEWFAPAAAKPRHHALTTKQKAEADPPAVKE